MLDPALGAIIADPGQMSQVPMNLLMNLLINARDAMPGSGKIIVETANVDLDEAYAARHPEVTPGPYVMLAVSDTGTGIEPETLEHIFEPFFTTKPRGKGAGLGLATVYGIVRQSSGWIWVCSEPGLGTTFKIYIARTGVAPRAVPQERAPVLRAAGYQTLVAANGQDALHYFEKGGVHIHLLFTDVIMPGMNGRDLAGRVAGLSPSTRVLYTSGYAAGAIVHRGVLDEGVDYLRKPFTPSRLLEKIREILDRPPAAGSPEAL